MNFDELTLAAKDWANRQKDVDVDANFDYMVTFAESIINRKLRVTRMARRGILTVGTSELETGYYALPNDYNGMRILRLNGCPVDVLSPEQIFETTNSIAYCVMADQIYITGVNDGDIIEMIYYQSLEPLGISNPSNWIARTYPDLYLTGIMFWLENFVKNYEIAGLWETKMYAAIDEINEADFSEKWSGKPMERKAG